MTQKTTDLPALLRLRAEGPATDYTHNLMRSAAAEIERLRAVIIVNTVRWAPHLSHFEIQDVINGKQV